jgi:hypothetical protein
MVAAYKTNKYYAKIHKENDSKLLWVMFAQANQITSPT